MKKLFFASLFFFSVFLAAADVELGGSSTIEAGLVVRASVYPIIAQDTDEIVKSAVVSCVKSNLGIDRFMEFCGDKEKLKTRLRVAVSSLSPSCLTRGVEELINACYTAKCDNLGCGLSNAELEQQCVARWKQQRSEANPQILREAIRSKSATFCSEGVSCTCPKPSALMEKSCVSRGGKYAVLGGCAECRFAAQGASGEGGGGDAIIIEEGGAFEEGAAEVEFPEGEAAAEGALGEEETASSEAALEATACSEGVTCQEDDLELISSVEIDATTSNSTYLCISLNCVFSQVTTTESSTQAAANPSCTDSDSKNFNALGTAVMITAAGTQVEKIDECASQTSLKEYYCEGTKMLVSSVSCSYGCENGACKAAQQQQTQTTGTTVTYTCTDTDLANYNTLGTVTIRNSQSNAIVSTNADTCASTASVTEYSCSASSGTNLLRSSAISCLNGCEAGACKTAAQAAAGGAPVTYTCTDTDSGQNTGTAGNVTITSSVGGSTTVSDQCVLGKVAEYYCSSQTAQAASVTSLDCAAGTTCYQGACIASAQAQQQAAAAIAIVCTDSDGGQVLETKGTASLTRGGTPTGGSLTDACGSGNYAYSYVQEAYCTLAADGNGTTASQSTKCSDDKKCVDGACVARTIGCIDSDGGQNVDVKGNATADNVGYINPIVSVDSCFNSTHVKEAFCYPDSSATSTSSKKIACTSGVCQDGACAAQVTQTTGGFSGLAVKKRLAPFTVKIVAVPSLLTGLQIAGEELPPEETGESETPEQCQDKCKGRLRALYYGSFSNENIATECKREVHFQSEFRKKFCEKPESSESECSAYLETACTNSQPALDKAKQLSQNQDKLLEAVMEVVESKCEAQRVGFETDGTIWNNLPPGAATFADGALHTVTSAKAVSEKTLKSGNFFTLVQKQLCLRYNEEINEAGQCSEALGKLKESIKLLKQLEALLETEEDKALALDAIVKFEAFETDMSTGCDAKKRDAAGWCGIFGQK